MERWSDASEDSDRFVQYFDNLGWLLFLKFCHLRKCDFLPAMCMKYEAFYRKPHIVSENHNESSNGSTGFDQSSPVHPISESRGVP